MPDTPTPLGEARKALWDEVLRYEKNAAGNREVAHRSLRARVTEFESRAKAEAVEPLDALADEWDRQRAEYPTSTTEGAHAAAFVLLCARELRIAITEARHALLPAEGRSVSISEEAPPSSQS